MVFCSFVGNQHLRENEGSEKITGAFAKHRPTMCWQLSKLSLTLTLLCVARIDSSIILNSLLDEEAQVNFRVSRSACRGQVCIPPPSDATCEFLKTSDQSVSRPTGEKVTCCTLYKCTNKDGSFFSYHGIIGKGKVIPANKAATKPTTTTTTRRTTTTTTRKPLKLAPKPVPATPALAPNAHSIKPQKPSNWYGNSTATTATRKPYDNTKVRWVEGPPLRSKDDKHGSRHHKTTTTTTTTRKPYDNTKMRWVEGPPQKKHNSRHPKTTTTTTTTRKPYDNTKMRWVEGPPQKKHNSRHPKTTTTIRTTTTTTRKPYDNTKTRWVEGPPKKKHSSKHQKTTTTRKTTTTTTRKPYDNTKMRWVEGPPKKQHHTRHHKTTTTIRTTTTENPLKTNGFPMNFPKMDFTMHNTFDSSKNKGSASNNNNNMGIKPVDSGNAAAPTSAFDRKDFPMTFPPMDFTMHNTFDSKKKQPPLPTNNNQITENQREQPNRNIQGINMGPPPPTTTTPRTTTKSPFDRADFVMTFPPMDFTMHNTFDSKKQPSQNIQDSQKQPSRNLQGINMGPPPPAPTTTPKSVFDQPNFVMTFPPMDFSMHNTLSAKKDNKEKEQPKGNVGTNLFQTPYTTTPGPFDGVDLSMTMPPWNFGMGDMFGKDKTTTSKSLLPSMDNGKQTVPQTESKSPFDNIDWSMTMPPMDFGMGDMFGKGKTTPKPTVNVQPAGTGTLMNKGPPITPQKETKGPFDDIDLSMTMPPMDFGMGDMFGKGKTTPKPTFPSMDMNMQFNNDQTKTGPSMSLPPAETKGPFDNIDLSMNMPPMDFGMGDMFGKQKPAASKSTFPSPMTINMEMTIKPSPVQGEDVDGHYVKEMKSVDADGNVSVNVIATGNEDAVAVASDGDVGNMSMDDMQKEMDESNKMMEDMKKQMDAMMGKK